MMPETDGVEIDDPDNYTTSTRLQQIFEARRQLREIRREASSYRHSGVGKRQKMRAVQYYRSGVESYLLEVDTLLREHDPGPALWSKKHYGTVTIQPPGKFTEKLGYYVAENIERGPNQPLKVSSLPEPKQIDIVGLKWLFETESPIQATFEFDIQSHTIGETYTTTASAVMSWTTLNSMVSDVNSFLGELGIGLDVDDTEEWKI
jgi:hypothetical protein